MARAEALCRVGAAEVLNLSDFRDGNLSERGRAAHSRLVDVDDDLLLPLRDRHIAARLQKIGAQPLHGLEGILDIDGRDLLGSDHVSRTGTGSRLLSGWGSAGRGRTSRNAGSE